MFLQILQIFSLLGVTVAHPSMMVLYGQLQQKPDSVIVLDCSSCFQQKACRFDYKRFPKWIEIPEEAIKVG